MKATKGLLSTGTQYAIYPNVAVAPPKGMPNSSGRKSPAGPGVTPTKVVTKAKSGVVGRQVKNKNKGNVKQKVRGGA